MGEVAAAPATQAVAKTVKKAAKGVERGVAGTLQDPNKALASAINPTGVGTAIFTDAATGGFFQPGIRREESQSTETNTGFLQSDINKFLQQGVSQSLGRTEFTDPEKQTRTRTTTTTRRFAQFNRELSPLTSVVEQEGFGSLVAFDQLEAFKKAFTDRRNLLKRQQREPGQVAQTRRS